MILYCVRHGESTYNAEGRVQGQADVPLSELGLRQGRAVAAALGRVPIDAIYSSPLVRAHQTAEMTARVLGLEIRTDDRLKELNAGVFQHKLRCELEDLYPDELSRWTSGELDFAIPGGESRRDLVARGTEFFQSLAGQEFQQVAVVSHGRLLITALKALLDIPLEAEPQSLQNGSITRIELSEEGEARLVAMDEVQHLAGIGLAGRGDL